MRTHPRSIFLVIVQAWIVPCHGFAYSPHSLGSVSPTARHASFAAPLPSPPAAGDRGTLSSLSMSDQGGDAFDPYRDEVCKTFMCTVAAKHSLRRLWYALQYTARVHVERTTHIILLLQQYQVPGYAQAALVLSPCSCGMLTLSYFCCCRCCCRRLHNLDRTFASILFKVSEISWLAVHGAQGRFARHLSYSRH